MTQWLRRAVPEHKMPRIWSNHLFILWNINYHIWFHHRTINNYHFCEQWLNKGHAITEQWVGDNGNNGNNSHVTVPWILRSITDHTRVPVVIVYNGASDKSILIMQKDVQRSLSLWVCQLVFMGTWRQGGFRGEGGMVIESWGQKGKRWRWGGRGWRGGNKEGAKVGWLMLFNDTWSQ